MVNWQPFLAKKKGRARTSGIKNMVISAQTAWSDLTQDYRNVLEINDLIGTLNEISILLPKS